MGRTWKMSGDHPLKRVRGKRGAGICGKSGLIVTTIVSSAWLPASGKQRVAALSLGAWSL